MLKNYPISLKNVKLIHFNVVNNLKNWKRIFFFESWFFLPDTCAAALLLKMGWLKMLCTCCHSPLHNRGYCRLVYFLRSSAEIRNSYKKAWLLQSWCVFFQWETTSWGLETSLIIFSWKTTRVPQCAKSFKSQNEKFPKC